MKTQVVVNKATRQVICTHFCAGKKHDFRLLKESKIKTEKSVKVLADSGYQGIKNLYRNAEIPKKKTKKRPLTKEDKAENREIGSMRVLVENVIGFIKRFKILSERYRNRRTRFGLRFNLIAAVHNFELL